jgi:hypothetical protein
MTDICNNNDLTSRIQSPWQLGTEILWQTDGINEAISEKVQEKTLSFKEAELAEDDYFYTIFTELRIPSAKAFISAIPHKYGLKES